MKFLLRKKFPGGKGEQPFGRKAPEVPEILLRRSFHPQVAKFLNGGEFAKRFADLEQILFSFGQILRSRFAAELCEAFTSFFAPAASKKSNKQALLGNFDSMRLLSL